MSRQRHLAQMHELSSREAQIKERIADGQSSPHTPIYAGPCTIEMPLSYSITLLQAEAQIHIDHRQLNFGLVSESPPSSLYRSPTPGNTQSQVPTLPASLHGGTDKGAAPVATGELFSPSRGVVNLYASGKPSHPLERLRRDRESRVVRHWPMMRRTKGLTPTLNYYKFTEKENIDFAEVQTGRFWVFECKVRAVEDPPRWYYLALRCPIDCECPVFSKNPLCEDRAARHLEECGQEYEDEYDMLRRYARIGNHSLLRPCPYEPILDELISLSYI